jgi:AraC-like DNA-binding protein
VPNLDPQPSLNTQGILNPVEGFARFILKRVAASADLAAFVERHWIVRWNLESPFEQEILPHPCVNLAFQPGCSAVHGIGTERAVVRLTGRGRVVATKFKPGAFHSFTERTMRSLLDQVVPVEEIFGPDAKSREASILAAEDDTQAIALLEALLRSRAPKFDANLGLVIELVDRVRERREIARADDLAREASMSLRSLHRLFGRYVGVGPKWVIRRTRAQEAAERVAAGAKVDWSALAHELGYHDQAHLIRDFKAQVGFTPAAYAARCADAGSQRRRTETHVD